METTHSSVDGLHVVEHSGSTLINVGAKERLVSAIAGFALVSLGIYRKSLLATTVGGYLLYRGASGNCAVYSKLGKSSNTDGVHKTDAVNIRTRIVVNRPRQEVYDFWRRLENLPKFMKHLQEVTALDDQRSHWQAKIPGTPAKISWDAEIVKEEQGSFLAWRSLENASIENAGKLEFRDFMNHRGTEIDVTITYRPPAGYVGSGLAWAFNGVFEKMIREDVRNFKQYIETGVRPSVKA